MQRNVILTIAIPTIVTRAMQFKTLKYELESQIKRAKAQDKVEIISECDNKEISIGKKRDNLIRKAQGKYIVMIDDDDWVSDDYIEEVLKATESDADCIGYLEHCNFDGHRNATSCISLEYKGWYSNIGIYDYVRSPYFKVPIKTELCKLVGCADMRWNEDEDFAKKIYSHLKKEQFINKKLYFYRFKYEAHESKYGFRNQ